MVCLYVCKISMEEWKEHGLCIRESEVQILGLCDFDFAAFKLVFSFSFVLISAPQNEFPCSVFEFADLFFHFVYSDKSFHGIFQCSILYSSSLFSVWYFLIFSISVEILTLLMHCSPNLSKHLYYDKCFELFIR